MKTSTYFALMAEFGTAQLPLEAICEKYFGLSFKEACRRAPFQQLPVPVFRSGSQKSGWLVDAADLARLIDDSAGEARRLWLALNDPRRVAAAPVS